MGQNYSRLPNLDLYKTKTWDQKLKVSPERILIYISYFIHIYFHKLGLPVRKKVLTSCKVLNL